MTFRKVQKSVTLNNQLNGVMVKLRQNMAIFQDGSRRHLGFSHFENFNAGKLNMAELRQCAKFCRNRLFFNFTRWRRRHAGFSNFRKF